MWIRQETSAHFISHMVQMKASSMSAGTNLKCLYIPHGSDESRSGAFWFGFDWLLYIPHGSDERIKRIENRKPGHQTLYPTWFRWKSVDDCLLTVKVFLYIPHGSDERNKEISVIRWFQFFISHMVQMKEIKKFQLSDDFNSLYPTWFRWKFY